jgi:hemerythrin-like domain-containing protein
MAYRFYREHKYVSAALNDLERLIAKTDFCKRSQVEKVYEQFKALSEMLEGHADYENTKLHALLKKKQSRIFEEIEKEHSHQEDELKALHNMLHKIPSSPDPLDAGYKFYLEYRKFVGENLIHLHHEETVILPELQRLYTDAELREVEAATYGLMSAEEILEMVSTLFPHMNPSDREAFLNDIELADYQKFRVVEKELSQLAPKAL